MQLGILETGDVVPHMAAVHGQMTDMFDRWLSPHLPEWTFATYKVIEQEFPIGPEACDAWLITGSRFGVYDPEPWIEPLKQFIRDAADANRPMIGICFGHQIVAEAMGGKAIKSPKGWGCGIDQYRVETDDGPKEWPMIVQHQDQVIEVPTGTMVLGGSDHCPLGVLEYEAPILTAQFHPEFVTDQSASLIRMRAGVALPEDLVARGLASLVTPPENAAAGAWAAAWLRQRMGA